MKNHSNLAIKWLFISTFALFLNLPFLQAQTITYQVDGDDLYSSECGDCSSGPDYRFRLRVNDQVNTAWSDWNTDIEDSGACEWIGVTNYSWRNATAGNNNTVITVQLNAYEDDDFFCGGDDGDCGGYATVGSNILTDLTPCTFHYFTGTRECDGITWGVEYSYQYTYDDLFPGDVAMASVTDCTPYDPAPINNITNATKWATYQWEMLTVGGTWTDVAGATSASYDPPSLQQTTSYRRRANDCSGRTAYSNVVSYTLTPAGVATLSLPSLLTDCASSNLQTINGGGMPVGGVYSGTGVTDNGDGTTFSLNPAAVTTGSIDVTYTGAASQEVYNNGVANFTGLTSGAISDVNLPNYVAAPFQLVNNNIVNQVNWSGFYANGNTPMDDNFVINIWSDNGGVPGTILYSLPIGNTAGRVATSFTIFGIKVYTYEAIIDFDAVANTAYHLSIYNDTSADTDDDWFWGYGSTSNIIYESSDNSAFSVSGISGTLDFALSSEVCPTAVTASTEFIECASACDDVIADACGVSQGDLTGHYIEDACGNYGFGQLYSFIAPGTDVLNVNVTSTATDNMVLNLLDDVCGSACTVLATNSGSSQVSLSYNVIGGQLYFVEILSDGEITYDIDIDCPDGCQSFVIYTDTSNLPTSTSVADYIETNSTPTEAVKVLTGQDVSMDAGNYIELNAEFEVELGGDFHGFIQGCVQFKEDAQVDH